MSVNETSINDYIIAGIQKHPRAIVELIEEIKVKRKDTTKQAVYAAIRKLKAEDIVVTYKKQVALNKIWIEKRLEYFQEANEAYKGGKRYDDILSLEDGDRITHIFKSPEITDKYWGHIFEVLADNIPKTMPIIIYNPHEWFLVAREESEKQIFENLNKEKKLLLLTVGNNSPLEKSVLKEAFKNWQHQYNLNVKLNYQQNNYINIFGDFIIEARLDETVTAKINQFYQNNSELTPEKISELKNIVAQRGKNKLIISRNPKRAYKLRKQLSKDFYLPAGYMI